jgi:N-acetylglucosamine-6-phosphate deacetylase
VTRSRNRVKAKDRSLSIASIGLVDLHFHGAFGVDIMSATIPQLDEMSQELQKRGIAAFCPTTLSQPRKELLSSVKKLGQWIRRKSTLHSGGAIPLGIHLEGPFIHPGACGAHPPHSVRPFQQDELEQLWTESQGTLKILTLAPEVLAADIAGIKKTLNQLKKWSHSRKIKLSLGHSKASQLQATEAFSHGFTGVTHAWNALSFHHREPGALGAAVGKKGIYLEILLDQVHLSPTVIRWLLKLHSPEPICFISDCLSAGGMEPPLAKGSLTTPTLPSYPFGPLKIQAKNGACRFKDGSLAGGALLLSDSYCKWLQEEAATTGVSLPTIFRKTLPHVTTHPLQVLGQVLGLPHKLLAKLLEKRRVMWHIQSSNRIRVIPID